MSTGEDEHRFSEFVDDDGNICGIVELGPNGWQWECYECGAEGTVATAEFAHQKLGVHAKRNCADAVEDKDAFVSRPELTTPDSATFPCPRCERLASAWVRSKFWADIHGIRHYQAQCDACGPLQLRHPVFYTDVVCTSCAGRLSWATQYDTGADRTIHPLICSVCSSLASGGLRFSHRKQLRLLAELHSVDEAYDRRWLTRGDMPVCSRFHNSLRRDPILALAERRRTLADQLASTTSEQQPAVVRADELARGSLFPPT